MSMRFAIAAAMCLATAISGRSQTDAEPPAKPVLENKGKPIQTTFQCGEEELKLFERSCTDQHPCPVYLELSAIESVGNRIFAAGNFHSESATLSSVVLASEDGGKTWREPAGRIRLGSLDQIQFIDFENGWIGGQLTGGVPRDPFLLLTTDGGKTWRHRPVFGESRPGTLEGFRFESKSRGTIWIDRLQAGESGTRYEIYETHTGGESWMLGEVSRERFKIPPRRTGGEESGWRVRPDRASASYIIEKRAQEGWSPVARFLIRTGECKEPEVTLPEPEPPSAANAVPEPEKPGTERKPPSLRK